MKVLIESLQRIVFFFLVVLFLPACNAGEPGRIITIKNSLPVVRSEVISIPYADFSPLLNGASNFKIVGEEGGLEYAYQLEMLGEQQPQNILIQVTIPANEEILLSVEPGVPDTVKRKTFARYVPERFDDFAWENDVVAFRMYGKALEGRKDDAQGTDIWAKKTDELIIDKWYLGNDYHKDHGEGLDYYSVGQTLGAGDVAPYLNGKLYYSKHYREYDILDNGPLRTTFKLTFEPWMIEDVQVKVSKTISIDAGSQMNRIALNYSIEGADELQIAAGIAKREGGGEVIDKHKKGIFGYWEPEHGEDGVIGVGLVFNEAIDSVVIDKNQFLSLFNVKTDTPVVYYTGGAWNKAGKIKSAEEWAEYLELYKSAIESPLEIKIN